MSRRFFTIANSSLPFRIGEKTINFRPVGSRLITPRQGVFSTEIESEADAIASMPRVHEISAEEYDDLKAGKRASHASPVQAPPTSSPRQQMPESRGTRRIAVAMAYCTQDWELAEKLMFWSAELGPKYSDFDLILVSAQPCTEEQDARVKAAAEKAFGHVVFEKQSVKREIGWPGSCNAMFALACEVNDRTARKPFLWIEPDCVFTKRNWLELIDREYAASGRAFMGAMAGIAPKQHLTGIGVYPRQCTQYFNLTATNMAWDASGGRRVLAIAHVSKLIQQKWCDSGSLQPPAVSDLEFLSKEAAIFHRNKDGALIRMMRDAFDTRKAVKVETITTAEDRKLSVVVTTHRRPEKCLRAVGSAIKGGFTDVVVTASGPESVPAGLPQSVRVIVCSGDSNAAWLSGVEEARGEHILILHDDDMVLPTFTREVLPSTAENGFTLFAAKFHRGGIVLESGSCSGPSSVDGARDTSELREFLMANGRLSITPVRGVFKRSDLIEWLSEAGRVLPSECQLRSGFLVGNDLWIWLRATTKYGSYLNITKPLVALGADQDSTTVHDSSLPQSKLKEIYDITRAAFARTQSRLEIVTIVLDGAPFLMAQLATFNRLKLDWHWHIVEGVADAAKCTSWCARIPGRQSEDGTGMVLDDFAFHQRVSIYRQEQWPSKVDMVNAAVTRIETACVLMQVDIDEIWESRQIERITSLMASRPDCDHAMFWCNYYVGPGIVMDRRNCFANNPAQEWRRAWNFKPGQTFKSHEPPVLGGGPRKFIDHSETENLGLVFEHYAYSLASQVRFKEAYYKYHGALEKWRRLQMERSGAIELASFMPWMGATSGVGRAL